MVMNPDNNQNEIGSQKEQADSAREQQIDLDGKEISEAYNLTDVNVTMIMIKTHVIHIREISAQIMERVLFVEM